VTVRLERKAQRITLLLGPLRSTPARTLYASIAWKQRELGFKPGWAWHVFQDLVGRPPTRDEQKAEPVRPSVELEKWISLRPKKPAPRRSSAGSK
jgi:hypothetical protein